MTLTLAEISEPGKIISIGGKTTKNSFISLLGVDKSVNLLGSGNNIDKQRIAEDMDGYRSFENLPELKINGNSENLYFDLGAFNGFILTNALNGQKTCDVSSRIDNLYEKELSDVDDSGLDFLDPEEESGAIRNSIRKNFPETWIFKDVKSNNDGTFNFKSKVPDTISSFVISGFSVHPEKGLFIAEPKTIVVFQEFFVKIYLPYSVRLGETFKVDITVFNYLSQSGTAIVELFSIDGDFAFVDTRKDGNDCVKTASSDTKRSKTVTISNGNKASTSFLIKPQVTGLIKIRVKASSGDKTDEVERMMLIEHEGMTKSENFPILIRPGGELFSHNIILPIGDDSIQNSISIEASAVGDLLGPALSNIQNLM